MSDRVFRNITEGAPDSTSQLQWRRMSRVKNVVRLSHDVYQLATKKSQESSA